MNLPTFDQLNAVPEYDAAADVFRNTFRKEDSGSAEWAAQKLRTILDDNLVGPDAGPSELFESFVDRIVRVQGLRKWLAEDPDRFDVRQLSALETAAAETQSELYAGLQRVVPAGYRLAFNPDAGGFHPAREA